MKIKLCLIFCFFCLYSCQQKDSKVVMHMKKMYHKQILLPKCDECIFFGEDETWKLYPNPQLRLIIYIDSTNCTNCKISEIWNWKKVIEYAKLTDYQFQPLFIITPVLEKVGEILNALQSNPFEWPIYLDYEGKFLKLNNFLPNSSFYHIFMLNQDNKIVLIGNPLLNEKLWNLYEGKINLLLNID